MKYLLLLLFLLIWCTCVFAERDYYEVLGLNKDASDAEIKRAYKKLAMQYHPDKNKEEGAEKIFMEVTNAYQILSDPENRKKYDTFGHAAFTQGGGGGPGGQGVKFDFGDPFDIFKTFFGGGGGFGGEGMKFTFNMGGAGDGGGGGFNFGGFRQAGQQQQHQGRQQQQQPQRPKQPLYTQNTQVTLLTDDTFTRYISETGNAWLINFFAQDCDPCHNLAPVMEKVAENLKHIVNVGAVDCSKQKSICDRFNVQALPLLVLIPYGKENRDNFKRYEGDYSAVKIHDFALTGLPQDYVSILRLTQQYSDFFQIPKPKIVLYSKKDSVPPLFISLSLLFKDRIKFGFVPRSSAAGRAAEKNHEVSDFPTFLAVSPDGTQKEIYTGEISYPSLSIFINKFQKTVPKMEIPEQYHQITAQNFATVCPTSKLCTILLSANEQLQTEESEILTKILGKYARDKFKFGWVSSENTEAIRESVAPEANFVVFNPKNKKITWTSFTDLDGISSFLDSVLGGSAKWIKLDDLKLR